MRTSLPSAVVRGFARAAWHEDRRGWGVAALLLVFAAHAFRYWTWQGRDGHTYSDGYYTWLYARSLAFDFDINLTNDYALCGDPFHLGVDEGAGRPANPFYFGPALYMAPVLLLARLVVPLGSSASESWTHGCTGPYVQWTGSLSVVATALTVAIAYRVARRWYDEMPCALAALVIGLASPLNIFGTLTWYYSHLWAALSVALALLCAVRASEEPNDAGRWLVAGASAGLAALMRMQESLWLLVPLAAILAVAPAGWGLALKRASLLGFGFIAIFGIQLYVYQRMYGSPFVIPQGKLYIQLGHAHPWLLLFGARSGLLYWTPLLWLSVLGAPLLLVGRFRAMGIAMIVAAIANFYVASAALSWTGSATLGARVQTSMVPMLLLPAAGALTVITRWARLRGPSGVLLVLVPWLLMGWNGAASGVSNSQPVQAPQLYGSGATYTMNEVYKAIGNPFTLPATIVFGLRYGAPPAALDRLASEGIFQKHYRTQALMGTDTLGFAAPPSTYWSTGVVPLAANEVGLLPGARARFLVTLYWPWVTNVRITARPLNGSAKLAVRSGSFFRRHELGSATFTRRETLDIAVRPSAFDSGINEVLLTSDASLVLESIQFVDSEVHDTTLRIFH